MLPLLVVACKDAQGLRSQVLICVVGDLTGWKDRKEVIPAMSGQSRLESKSSDARPQTSTFSAAMNASCGISTFPYWRIFFLPSFCLSRSLRLREMSPP